MSLHVHVYRYVNLLLCYLVARDLYVVHHQPKKCSMASERLGIQAYEFTINTTIEIPIITLIHISTPQKTRAQNSTPFVCGECYVILVGELGQACIHVVMLLLLHCALIRSDGTLSWCLWSAETKLNFV